MFIVRAGGDEVAPMPPGRYRQLVPGCLFFCVVVSSLSGLDWAGRLLLLAAVVVSGVIAQI